MYIDLLLVNNKIKISLKKPKAVLLAFGFLCLNFNLKAQVNYVLNPSFEQVDSCPVYLRYIKAINWDTLVNGGGYNPDVMTPCYANPLASIDLGVPLNFSGANYQQPRTGSNYHNFLLYGFSTSKITDYLQGKFNKPLKQKNYCVTYYVNLSNNSKYAIDKIGAVIDNGQIKSPPGQTTVVPTSIASPSGIFISDTLNWTKVQGLFSAQNNQTYITLGNFNLIPTTNTIIVNPTSPYNYAYYFIDDVSVLEADLPAYAGRDTVLCIGDSVFIGRPPEIGLECTWFNPSAGSGSIAVGGGLWVKPATTQTYVVSQDVCGLIKTDTIQVKLKPKYTGTVSLVAQATPSLVCPNNTVTLSVVEAQPITNYTYNWQNTVTLSGVEGATITANVLNSTQFTVTAYNTPTDAFCPYNFSTTVNVNVKPTLTLTPKINLTNTITCLSDTLKFTVINTPTVSNVTYNWQPFNLYTNTNTTTAKALILNNSYYFVTLTSLTDDLLNCPFVKKDSIYISLQDTCGKNHTSPLILPQLISVNGDGINDEIVIQLPNTISAKLQVFNRWGSLVAELAEAATYPSTTLRVIWNGTYKNQALPAGTYFYIVESVNTNNEQKNYRQFVVLVR